MFSIKFLVVSGNWQPEFRTGSHNAAGVLHHSSFLVDIVQRSDLVTCQEMLRLVSIMALMGINFRLQWRFTLLSDLYPIYNDNCITRDFGARFRSIQLKLTCWLNIQSRHHYLKMTYVKTLFNRKKIKVAEALNF